MVSLTVGYVSGFIALAIAVLSFLLPNMIALLMASLVGRERSAVTWSVLGRQLHKSFWATLLNSDSTSSKTPLPIRLLSWLELVGIVLVTVAGVITPLGLHSDVRLSNSPQTVSFGYMADSGPMGYGTPARDTRSFLSRICSEDLHIDSCPFSNTVVDTSYNSSGSLSSWNGTYDVRLPYVTADVFSSVHDEHPITVAGALDMEWRQYAYSQRADYNNDSSFQVGMTRLLSSLILDDNVQAVEGVVVDTVTGGVGLRNHTVPMDMELGAEWEEELLFLSPDSVCVDTNLTLDYEIGPIGSYDNYSANNIVNVSLTDRGGFVNINKTYPERNHYDGQSDPDLWFRAYKAAWWSNAMNMMYFNVTNPRDAKHAHAFQYLNSSLNKRFWLNAADVPPANTASLTLSNLYSAFFTDMGGTDSTNSTFGLFGNSTQSSYSGDPRAKYANPFKITSSNFSSAGLLCSGVGGQDFANISNLAVSCGLLYGAATRLDGTQSLVLEAGSKWTQKMYSCATAVKAEIKQVRFQWNSTATGSDKLQRLQVLNVTTKTYASNSDNTSTGNTPGHKNQQQQDQPWWAVENLQRALMNMSPIWGLVSSDMAKRYANDSNFNFVQSPRLYVPGMVLDTGISASTVLQDNIAAPHAISTALGAAYNIGRSSQYSGQTSMAILAKWQRLCADEANVAQIPGLIFTDNLANLVLGSRSWLSNSRMPNNTQPPLSSSSSSSPVSVIPSVPVYTYQSRIAYNWLYAIPAFLTLAVFAAIFAMTFTLLVLGKIARVGAISDYLKRTSSGRLLLAIDEHRRRSSAPGSGSGSPGITNNKAWVEKNEVPDGFVVAQSTKSWVRGYGLRVLDLFVTTDGVPKGGAGGKMSGTGSGVTACDGGATAAAFSGQHQHQQHQQYQRMGGGYKPVPQVVTLDRTE